jgi:hypothetical protein
MNTEKKKRLLADTRNAIRAIGRMLDNDYDLSQILTFTVKSEELLRESSFNLLAGLALLDDTLAREIGTDNL